MKEFVTKHWKWIALAAILLAAFVWYMKSKKTSSSTTGDTGSKASGNLAALKTQLDDCEKNMANIRLVSGASNPCQSLRDEVAKLA